MALPEEFSQANTSPAIQPDNVTLNNLNIISGMIENAAPWSDKIACLNRIATEGAYFLTKAENTEFIVMPPSEAAFLVGERLSCIDMKLFEFESRGEHLALPLQDLRFEVDGDLNYENLRERMRDYLLKAATLRSITLHGPKEGKKGYNIANILGSGFID